jgi:hypothetical protein
MPLTRPAGLHAEPLAEGTRRGHPRTSLACTSAHALLTGEIRKMPTVHNPGRPLAHARDLLDLPLLPDVLQ